MFRLLFLLFCIGCLAGVSAAQDRMTALDRARAKFVKEVARLDETLLATIDKTFDQATKAGNRAVVEKLKYERPLFVSDHLIPTAVPTADYVRERSKSTAALLAAYQPVITDLTKAKKFAELEAVEDPLDETLKTCRGYGLALPDLQTHAAAVFTIENKDSGLVIDVDENRRGGRLILTPKSQFRKSQFWRIERVEANYALINVASGLGFDLNGGNRNAGFAIDVWPVERKGGINPHLQFKLNFQRRYVTIEPSLTEFVLTATEEKLKGVITTYVTQEKKESPPADTQLWRFIELK